MLIEFSLSFYGTLFNSEGGFILLKEYNKIVSQKDFLTYLQYKHERIGGHKLAKSKELINSIVNKVSNM